MQYYSAFQIYCDPNGTDLVLADSGSVPSGATLLAAGLLMEKLDINLQEWLDRHQIGKIGQQLVEAILRQIGGALLYLHQRLHIVYIDHKPWNIVLVGDPGPNQIPHLKLIDFGMARVSAEYEEARQLSSQVSIENPQAAKTAVVSRDESHIPNDYIFDTQQFGDMLLEMCQVDRVPNVRDKRLRVLIEAMASPDIDVTIGWALAHFEATNTNGQKCL